MSIARNLHLPGLEKINILDRYIRTHTNLLNQTLVFVLLKIKEGSEPYHRDKKISALINDWENDNVYGKNPSKARPWLAAGKCNSFRTVNG